MNRHPSGHWGLSLVRAGLLLLGVAVVARVTYDLLAPLIPALLTLLLLGSVVYLAVGRHHR